MSVGASRLAQRALREADTGRDIRAGEFRERSCMELQVRRSDKAQFCKEARYAALLQQKQEVQLPAAQGKVVQPRAEAVSFQRRGGILRRYRMVHYGEHERRVEHRHGRAYICREERLRDAEA